MVRWPRGQGRKPPLGWSRGAPSGTDRSWCHRGDRVTGRKCPRQRGENGPQLPALLQAPHSASAGHARAGRWPGACRSSCREQRRAGKGRTQAQLQSGVTGLSGRRHGHRSDTGGGGLPVGEQAKSIWKPTTAEAPVQRGKRCPGLQGPRVCS